MSDFDVYAVLDADDEMLVAFPETDDAALDNAIAALSSDRRARAVARIELIEADREILFTRGGPE